MLFIDDLTTAGKIKINHVDLRMKFPKYYIESPTQFLEDYSKACEKARRSVAPSMFGESVNLIECAYQEGKTVYVCGNGGSTAIANHMVCDHGKLVATDTLLKPRVISLSHPTEMITAIANDISYDDIFSYQLELMANRGDVLMVISGSGESPNVVKALKAAQVIGMKSIAMTAFSGGQCRDLADVSLHVEAENYGIAEDVHQSLMQMMAQFIRMRNMDRDMIITAKF